MIYHVRSGKLVVLTFKSQAVVLSTSKTKTAHHVVILGLVSGNVRLLSDLVLEQGPCTGNVLTTKQTIGVRRQRGERPLAPAAADTSSMSLVYRKTASGWEHRRAHVDHKHLKSSDTGVERDGMDGDGRLR